MMNFEFQNPTHLIFGAGSIIKLGEVTRQYGKKALIVTGGFPVHMIEHSLSAHQDVTHGAGLAILNPAWMRFAAKSRPARFAQFASRVMGISEKFDSPVELANAGIDKFEEFLKSIGCPTRLSELKIGDELFEQYAKDALQIIHDENGCLPGRPPMTTDDIVSVFCSAL